MGFWQFFWKSKKMSNTSQKQKAGGAEEKAAQVAKGGAEKRMEGQGEKPSRTDSKRRRMDKSTIMSKSSSSGLRESTATPTSTQVTMSNSSRRTPADSISQSEKKELNMGAGERGAYQQNPRSRSSIGQDHFTAIGAPTLHAKRGDYETSVPRHKSSKRKAEDLARERELRAMSSPIPIPKRPLSYGEGPLRRDTQKTSGRLRKHADRHASDVSLPVPESLSDIGVASNQSSFKVGALDMLSPRPTVRYTTNPRSMISRSQNLSRGSTQHPIAEEDCSSKRRIDDLANSLDASALRELMERDQRRRERKRKTDQAKLEQKLKRTADNEKGPAAHRSTRTRTDQENEATDPAFSSSSAYAPAHAEDGRGGKASADPFADGNTIEPELPVPPRLRPGSSIYTRTSQASFSPPTSPTQRAFDHASLSQASAIPREATPDLVDTADLSSKASEQSNVQLGSWASFFKRSGTRGNRNSVERGSHVSGAFSNTSRDSIPRPQPQPSVVGAPRTFRRSDTPQRTQSKFREDLPELPLSPPDSRVQSPEAGIGPVIVTAPPDQGESTADSSKLLANSPHRATCDETAKDVRVSQLQPNEPQIPSAAVLSQSLASVDSEASWLSGKPAKRSSVQRDHPLRQSQSSLQPHLLDSDAGEEADVADDPYFSRLSPDHEERRRLSSHSAPRKASSTALNIDPDGESAGDPQERPYSEVGNEKWHSSLGRQPTLIRQAALAKSKEGLLKEYQATDAESGIFEDELSDPDSPDAEDPYLQGTSSPIFRAQSVNYGSGHVRHISAGSAKLLDIRRSSIDSKRLSLPRGERCPTPLRSPAIQQEE